MVVPVIAFTLLVTLLGAVLAALRSSLGQQQPEEEPVRDRQDASQRRLAERVFNDDFADW